jgi:hypothetical protein
MKLQPLAVVGDAQAIRDVFAESALGGRFIPRQLAPPLYRYQLPSSGRPLLHHGWAEWSGNDVAYPFKVRHGVASPQISRFTCVLHEQLTYRDRTDAVVFNQLAFSDLYSKELQREAGMCAES